MNLLKPELFIYQYQLHTQLLFKSSFFGIPTYLNRLYLLSENYSRSERRMQYSMQLQPHAVH